MCRTRLCPRCAGKMADSYEARAHTDMPAVCAMRGDNGYLYDLEQKRREPVAERRRAGSGYSAAERERYEKRRRWA